MSNGTNGKTENNATAVNRYVLTNAYGDLVTWSASHYWHARSQTGLERKLLELATSVMVMKGRQIMYREHNKSQPDLDFVGRKVIF